MYGNWLRLFPVSFRALENGKKFQRWDKVSFEWKMPSADQRPESRHIKSQTLEIIGSVKPAERLNFLNSHIVESLVEQRSENRSLALIRPEITNFKIIKKSQFNLRKEQERIDEYHKQDDFFISKPTVPKIACPYEFKYQYKTKDGNREGTCQDWETEATFFNWRNLYGEAETLKRMNHQFGEVLPKRGLCFAMGTHSLWPDTWLINGLIQLRTTDQPSFL